MWAEIISAFSLFSPIGFLGTPYIGKWVPKQRSVEGLKGQRWWRCALWIVPCRQLPPLFLFMNELCFYNTASWLHLHGNFSLFYFYQDWITDLQKCFFRCHFYLWVHQWGRVGWKQWGLEADWGQEAGKCSRNGRITGLRSLIPNLYWDPEEQLEMVWPVLTQIAYKDWSDGDFTVVLSLCDFFYQSCIRKKTHLINILPSLHKKKI